MKGLEKHWSKRARACCPPVSWPCVAVLARAPASVAWMREGKRIAKGLVNYSSSDLVKIKGLKTSEIEKRLEYKHSDEAIHRDNLVMTPEDL